jgi:hypothetical protein
MGRPAAGAASAWRVSRNWMSTKSIAAMATFTSGPAMAMATSCPGRSGMRSRRATPPMGKSVMSRVFTP